MKRAGGYSRYSVFYLQNRIKIVLRLTSGCCCNWPPLCSGPFSERGEADWNVSSILRTWPRLTFSEKRSLRNRCLWGMLRSDWDCFFLSSYFKLSSAARSPVWSTGFLQRFPAEKNNRHKLRKKRQGKYPRAADHRLSPCLNPSTHTVLSLSPENSFFAPRDLRGW